MVLDALKKRLHDAANSKGGKWICLFVGIFLMKGNAPAACLFIEDANTFIN
jgi:hypothetical protein